MKTSKKITYAVAATAIIGALIYVTRKANSKKRIRQVANQGYETAADILHPNTNQRFKKLHYGPVLPHHDF